MGITIKEIAALCGVSVGTVDRALNNRPGISPKTKAKILEVARQYNYKPDFLAQSLAKGRTMTIGLVLFDLYNRSFAQLAGAVEASAREQGYSVDLVLTDKDLAIERDVLRRLHDRKTDGIILFPINEGAEFEQYLHDLGTPLVTVCNRLSDAWDYVGINDRQAMKEAARHVLERGYRQLIYICPPLSYRGVTNIYTQEERYQGFLEAVDAYLPELGVTVIEDKQYLRALDALPLTDQKTAIMCSCDAYALEVLHYLQRERQLRVPDDVGLIGFDHIDMLKYVQPQLTTVEYNVEQMGREAVRLLLERIEAGTAAAERRETIVDYAIISGSSL
jgi:LacI family transcriptional regulator